MYLPQWLAAAIAVFNAASDELADSAVGRTYEAPSPAANTWVTGSLLQIDREVGNFNLSPANLSEGEVIEMYASLILPSLFDQQA